MYARSTKSFEKMLRKQQRSIQEKFRERLKLFLIDPRHTLLDVHMLTGEWANCKSMNVTGDARAIFLMSQPDCALFIAIGTHSELYGK
jgi:mRNA-degrading endonuclease YafQ of YafQ-DinJ toxin-antitoxin module